MWLIWLIASGVFLVVEIMTAGFLTFWLGLGALLAMVTSFFTDNLIIQTAVFVISSVLLILCTKPFVNKYINKKTVPTNAYTLIGKTGIVTKDINTVKSTGLVKIGSEIWSAKTEDDTIIPENSEVEVIKLEGVKVIVKAIKVPSTLI
jgi:membrane protein implicated in regulation of membrane protease activity